MVSWAAGFMHNLYLYFIRNDTDHQPLLLFCIQQSTPDEDLKPEDYLELKSLGSACLAEGASAQLQQFLEDKKNQVVVVESPHIYR